MAVEYERKYFANYLGVDSPYRDFPQHPIRAKRLIEITNPTSVLDVGCAYGYIVKYLLKEGVEAWGCDVSKHCETKAKEIIPNHFRRCPAWELDFDDKSFDVVYCEGVLEHLPEDKIEQVFKEFERVGKRFYLQASLEEHDGALASKGHTCIKPAGWWFGKMPMHSWLALLTATDQNGMWLYKG